MAEIPINRQRTTCADKNDRLGWKDGFCLDVEGVEFGVRSNQPELLEKLRGYFPAGATAVANRPAQILLSFLQGGSTQRKGVKNYHVVYDAWNRIARTLEMEEALQAFAQAVRYNLAVLSQQHVYLNASVLEHKGKGVLVLGEGGSKLARLDTDHGLLSESGSLLDPALVVFVQSGTRPRHRRLEPGAAALRLLHYAPAVTVRPDNVLPGLAWLSQRAPSYRSSIRDKADLTRLLDRCIP